MSHAFNLCALSDLIGLDYWNDRLKVDKVLHAYELWAQSDFMGLDSWHNPLKVDKVLHASELWAQSDFYGTWFLTQPFKSKDVAPHSMLHTYARGFFFLHVICGETTKANLINSRWFYPTCDQSHNRTFLWRAR